MNGNRKPSKREWDIFVAECIANGWPIKMIRHPKSKANWNNEGIRNPSWAKISKLTLKKQIAKIQRLERKQDKLAMAAS